MPSISASFKWKDSRGYVNWSASGLTAGHHYRVVPIKWVNSGCHVLATWGFIPSGTTYSKESKISGVEGVGTIRVCLCNASDIEVCQEGDYQSGKVLAYDDVSIPAVPCYPEGTHEVLEYCPDGVTEKKWRDCVSGKWVEGSGVCPECSEGTHEVLEYCPDGVTEKKWRDCVSGKWVEGSGVCPECSEGAHEVLEYCPDGVTEKKWRDCVSGKWVEGSQPCCFPEGKHEVLEYCPDDVTEKRWRDCVSGKWVESYRDCAECSPEGKHVVLEYCPDGTTEKRWKDCIDGKWRFDSQECPAGTCTEGETTCAGFDLYKCIDGWFRLVEEKSSNCGYVPSEGDTRCVGKDLYKYESGGWVLYEANSTQCSQEPPGPPIVCPIAVICIGTPLVDFLGPLRVFRDKILKQFNIGRRFVQFYYNKLTPLLSPEILKMRRRL